MISPRQIRSGSLREAQRLGYPINEKLPLLSEPMQVRSKPELAHRLFCLTAVVAAAWGHPRDSALKWLEREKLISYLSEAENKFLKTGEGEDDLRWQVEAICALTWCAGFVDDLNFDKECSDDLVELLPDLQRNESSVGYYDRVELRDMNSIIAKCDLAYCLHWAVRDAIMHRQRPAGPLHPIRVVERRRALEWILSRQAWDSVVLDT